MLTSLAFLLFVLSWSQLGSSRSPDYTYRLKEEVQVNYIIGYLNNDIPKFRMSNFMNYRILNIRDTGVTFFSVEQNSSKLIVNNRIDREFLCSPSVSDCFVILKIAIQGTDNFLTIKIEIEDINDHNPVWPMNRFRLSFYEGEPAGSRKSIPSASDPDSGENGKIKYSLESSSDSFMLVQEHGLYLQTLKQLDREAKDGYQLTVIAQDHGSTPRSSRLEIDVEVHDVNDNTPRFTTSIFRPSKLVPENIPVGSVVLTLTATDADSGPNGEFSFSFSTTETSLAKSYFFVRQNGEIVVQRQLDYDSGNHNFEFKVIVTDHASSGYQKSSESRVEIAISDENDEYPVIRFYPIITNSESGYAVVDENKSAMTSVALVHATDKDFKNTDTVSCSVDSFGKPEMLSLVSTNENNEFKLLTARSFDRELESKIYIGVRCTDSANHVTTSNLTVEIGDVNDNPPRFSEKLFNLHIRENMDPGTMIKDRVRAVDRDDGSNGFISYSIDAADSVPFTIEPRSGILRSKLRLDRETKSSYQFVVIATDHGKPALSSSTTIIVNVEDENDNPVIIDPYPNEFHVAENLPPNTNVGKISAKDMDNQTILFSLESIPDAGKFKIDRMNGQILTKVSLDREVQQQYHFRVYAKDSVHTASIMVTIFIDDINDNPPVFVMPNSTNNMHIISSKETSSVMRIQATDVDEKENAQIQYFISSGNSQLLFTVEKDSGILYFETPIYTLRLRDKDHFSLDLQACDMGKPRLCTNFKGFRIYLEKFSDKPNSGGNPNSLMENSGINENIIIALIVFLLLMIIATVVIILLLRRKTRTISKSRKSPQPVISSSTCYYPNSSGKYPVETDQCSAEICELTSRLSPVNEFRNPINQMPYYNLADQYQCENFIPVNSDHLYHMPMMINSPQQFPDQRTIQTVPENGAYYSKYDMNDTNSKPIESNANKIFTNDILSSTCSTGTTCTPMTPSQKQRKSTTVGFNRKPQSSFV